jgi:predicted RNA-binding protein YlxR (DUF448 family)
MCIGCRKKKKKEEMLRLVKSIDGVVSVDEKKRMKGRGLYLCPDPTCFKMARKKERWGESLESMSEGFLLREVIREERE